MTERTTKTDTAMQPTTANIAATYAAVIFAMIIFALLIFAVLA
jgi:hypothetical protein